jgi:hypothetical protein
MSQVLDVKKTVPHGSIKGLGVEGRKNIMPE